MECRVLQSRDCRITQPFHYKGDKGYTYYHGGIDLVRYFAQLDWIVAHTEGKVIGIETKYTGQVRDGSYGNYVWVMHPNGYSTFYAHLAYNTIKVHLGEYVTKGQVLGYMDNTGHSEGGHLHWEVRTPENVQIDPEPYLNAELPNSYKWVQKWHLYQGDTMLKGWQKVKGKWYYLEKTTGIMLTGWVKDGDKWYYLSSNGDMLTGWQKINNKWYYLTPQNDGAHLTGEMWTGWLKDKGKWYYLDLKNGDMYTGTHTIDGKTYTFDSSGALIS